MGLGLWKCSDGPVKSATGPWSRWRAHIFTDGEKQVKFSMAKPVQAVTGPEFGDGPTKKWRKNIQKSLFWACYRWNFGKIKTSRFLYTLGASFSAKKKYNFTVPLTYFLQLLFNTTYEKKSLSCFGILIQKTSSLLTSLIIHIYIFSKSKNVAWIRITIYSIILVKRFKCLIKNKYVYTVQCT